MSENLARYNVILDLVANTRGVDEVEKKVGGLERRFTSAKAAFAGVLAGVAIQSIGQQIFDVTAKFQGYESVLKNTLGTQLEAEKALNLIKETAKGTVFSVDELTSSYLKFANRGIKLTGEEITKLADIAASQGKSFDQLTEAVLDAQTGEFERLKEFGIRASKSGDEINFAFKGVNTTIKNTPEAINALIASYGELQGVQGSNITQMETLNGRMSNIKDTVDELFVKIGKALLPVFNFLLDIVVSVISALGTFANILISIPKFIEENALAFKALGIAIVSFNIPLIISTALLIKNTIASKAKAAADFFLASRTGLLTRAQWLLNAAFAANPIGVVIAAVALLVAGFVILYNKSETVRNIFAGIGNVVKSLINVFKDFSEKISTVFSGGFLDGLKNIGKSIVNGIKKNFKEAFSDLENIINGKDVADSALRLAAKVLNIMTFGLGTALTKAGKFVIDAFTKGFEENKDFEAKVNIRLNRGSLGGSDAYKKNLEEAKKAAEKLREQQKAELALRLEDENAALKRQINVRKSYGKETGDLEKAVLSNERKILELRKETKSKILDKINELEVFNIKESLQNEKNAIETKFGLQELEARQTIKNAEDLALELKKIELKKQLELSEIAIKNIEKNTPAFVALQNQILEIKAEYDSLFNREKVDVIDFISPSQTVEVKKQVDVLRGVLDDLRKDYADEKSPLIKIDILEQIKKIQKEIASLGSPLLLKDVFKFGGIDAIDITDLLPEDQVKAIQDRLKIVQDAIKSIGNIDSIPELDQFENLKDEAAKLKEYLDNLGVDDGFVQKLFGLNDEDFEDFKQGLLNAYNVAKDSLNQILDAEIESADRRIELQQERVNAAEKIAEKGNVKQLELEEERLSKLQEKREKFVAAQRILGQLEILQSNAVAAANAIQAITAGFKAGGPAGIISGIATSIALAAQIAAIVSTVRNSFSDIPGFFLGSELISADPRFKANKVSNGKDGYVFRGDGTERMVDGTINSKLNGFPNALLPDAVKLYQMQSTSVPKIVAINSKGYDKELVAKMDRMIESFESTKTSINLDKKGLVIAIEKMIQQRIDRKRYTA